LCWRREKMKNRRRIFKASFKWRNILTTVLTHHNEFRGRIVSSLILFSATTLTSCWADSNNGQKQTNVITKRTTRSMEEYKFCEVIIEILWNSEIPKQSKTKQSKKQILNR
jgi:hypothetical protein